jgi:hypothetical protein
LTPKNARLRKAFVETLALSPNIQAACDSVGWSRAYAYRLRYEDPDFKEAWDAAIESGVDRIEAKAFERAEAGESDTLTIFILKNRRREVYQETVRNEHSGPDGGPIDVHVVSESFDHRVAALLARVRGLEPSPDVAALGEGPPPLRLAALGETGATVAGGELDGVAAPGGARVREDADGG